MTADRNRILVVDDDNLSRELLARTLERSGYEVIESQDGHEALQVIQTEGAMLLVLDYEMPDLNGAQICEIVRKNENPQIAALPIILLTAHSGEDHEIECLKAGANDFVSKPVNTAILRARIDTHLRLHTLRAQLQEQNAELERSRARHELDLEAARLTQQALLPAKPPGLVGWDIASFYQPVIQVGGDMYDWLRLPNNHWLVWIADATGHGASAALLTTLTKLVFRHAASDFTNPCEVLNAVNSEFFAIFKGRSFMTAACLTLNPASGAIRFAGAGHPGLLVSRASGKLEEIPSQGPPVGIRAELACEEATIELDPTESVLLYTDGLFSGVDANGIRLGPHEVSSLLPEEAVDATDFLKQTINNVRIRARSNQVSDDLAAIVLRRT